MLREDALSGIPPFKAAFVGAPPQRGFARHGRGLRRVRGMRRRSFASEGSRERSEAPEGTARCRAHAHRMPCRLSRPLAGTSLRSCARLLRNLRGFPPKRLRVSPAHLASLESVSLPPTASRSAAGHAEPGAEAACLFLGTPGMSHATRCADKGVANEGWDPQNRQPRSDRPPICRSVTQYPLKGGGR